MAGTVLAAVIVAATTLLGAAQAEPAAGPSPVGRWTTMDDKTGKPRSIVEIAERKGRLYGRVLKLVNLAPGEDPAPKCDKCEGARKDQPVVGMEILWNLERDDDEWEGGRILDPETGKVYRCTLWLDGPDRLKVRGHWGVFYRTQTWHRAP